MANKSQNGGSVVLAVGIILNAVIIGIWLYILNYMYKLHEIGCTCADDWRRNYIMYFIIFLIIVFLLQILGVINNKSFSPFIMTIYFILTVVFIMIVYHYIYDLKTKPCKCSEDTARTILEYFNYIQIALLSIVIILMVYCMFYIAQHKDQIDELLNQKREKILAEADKLLKKSNKSKK
jgi:glucose-6-phosphate-specific signal transduction histidine kinase